jgi:predicted RNA-binding Zn-ribbon protein involved in translation (DUF1610 family)
MEQIQHPLNIHKIIKKKGVDKLAKALTTYEAAEYDLRQLKYLHDEAESYSTKDVLEILYDLSKHIETHGILLGACMREIVENLRLADNCCPDCGETLHTKCVEIDYSGDWIKQIQGEESYKQCNNCGWSNKDE